MAGILDILTNKLNNSLSNLYNADKIGQLEYNAGRDYGYKNTASGPVSDFRHQAAMNELSKSLGPNALSNVSFIPSGDTLAFTSGLINEIPALFRGLDSKNLKEIGEDIVSNFKGTYLTSNKETPESIYEKIFSNNMASDTVRAQPRYETPQEKANNNFLKTLSNLVFTPAGAAEVMPENVKNQGLDSFNNLVSDTVMAEPNQFQDYPGVENLGGVQNFDLEGVRDIISQMEEEKGNYIERPEDGFNMNGILQSLGGYAKDAAGRYIGSQALGGAGGMLFGPYGALIGGIFGALKGGDLFNQNTYSQQMYNNLTPGGQAYANSLYAPGGLLQGYNQISAFGTGPLGLISKNLSRYGETMSPARRNAYLDAANRIINSQDYSKTGIAAVTKKGTHAYDDSIINYAPPSGGDSGGWSGGSGGFGQGFSTSSSGTEETF